MFQNKKSPERNRIPQGARDETNEDSVLVSQAA